MEKVSGRVELVSDDLTRTLSKNRIFSSCSQLLYQIFSYSDGSCSKHRYLLRAWKGYEGEYLGSCLHRRVVRNVHLHQLCASSSLNPNGTLAIPTYDRENDMRERAWKWYEREGASPVNTLRERRGGGAVPWKLPAQKRRSKRPPAPAPPTPGHMVSCRV